MYRPNLYTIVCLACAHSFAYQEFIIFSNLILAHARSGKLESGTLKRFLFFSFHSFFITARSETNKKEILEPFSACQGIHNIPRLHRLRNVFEGSRG